MSILCVITSLFQLVILVALTGVLVAVAAVSRLMEVTISLVHPITLFLLRQSGKLVILSVHLTARLTSRAYSRMCARGPTEIGTEILTVDAAVEINVRAPDIPYSRSAIPGLVKETSALATTETTEDPAEPSSAIVEEENGGPSVDGPEMEADD